MKKLIAVVVSLVFAQGAHAAVSDATCLALAKEIVTSTDYKVTDERYRAIEHYANCESSSDASSAGLDIAAKVFSLGVKWDDSKRKSACSNSDADKSFSKETYDSSKRVFDQTLGVISDCLKYAAHDWDVKYRIFQHDALSLTVANGAPKGNDILAIKIFPPNSLKCEGMPDKYPYTVTPQNPVALTCTRQPQSQIVDGVSVKSAEGATIDLVFADGPFPIELPGYKTSIIDSMRSDIDLLKSNQAALNKNLLTWSSEKPTFGERLNGGDPSKIHTTTCADGYYAVGVNWWGSPNSTHYCIGCATDVQVICRKLNSSQ